MQALINPGNLAVCGADQVVLASARIRAYCRWHIFPSLTVTKSYDGPGQQFFMLPTLYLTDVAELTEDGNALTPDVDFEWSESGQLWRAGGVAWSGHFRAITPTYTHGYDELPEELRDVAIQVATRIPAQLVGVSQEQGLNVSKTYGGLLSGQASISAAFTAAELVELDRYRLNSRP